MAQALLDVSAITSGYGEGTVIDNLSLQVKTSEVVGLMGRNGVGKSTLLKTLMGLIKPRQGSIRMAGRDVAALEPYEVASAGIGYVPQGREIFHDFTVEENLLLGNLNASRAELLEIYQLFPVLKDRAKSIAGAFSGGQQQQLAIARALMGNPRLLLLDEPSEGIQPTIVNEIGQLLKRIAQQKGIAIILVEQNIDMVTSVCQRVLFMDHGAVNDSVPAAELVNNPDVLHTYLGL